MALNIEQATLGYDANNVQAAFNSLNQEVIGDTITLLQQGTDKLKTATDQVWVGQSAEQFKKNIEFDADYISKCLEETRDILRIELDEIVNKMDEVDQNLVKGRE